SFIDEFRELSRIAPVIDQPGSRQMLETRLQANNLITYELRNASSAEIVFSLENALVFEGMREVSDAFARFCLDNAFGSDLTSAVDPLLDMAVRSPEAGLWFFFDRPDEVHRISFGPVPMFVFWNTIRRPRDSAMLHVYILQSASRLTQQLIRYRLLTSLQTAKPFTLAAMNQKNDTWLPEKVYENQQLRDFAARLLFSEKPEEMKLSLAGNEYLVSGQRGKYSGNYSLFAFYPYQLITDEINNLRKQIGAAMLLFTILAMLAAWLLSDTFLLPVSRLGAGVAAIHARNHGFRIEQDQQDEFGDLAASFNHMIADLKEMQLARDVQESLLPAVIPALPGYQLSFANRMASAVGGDYYDVQVLDSDNIFVVIGDVSGHGVGSALVMSMAKAIVYHGLKESRDLISIFSDLNLAVNTYFSRPPVRKMITLFAATLNLSSGRGSFVNAGHNFPVQVTAAGQCNDLESIHLPVGAVASLKKLATRPFQMLPGDSVVFYTDGLVEAANPAAGQYGYTRLKNLLTANAGVEPELLSARLLAAYDDWLAGHEQDDDVTLVILRRQPAASA
ncbi:MAG TPA: SpoIIE family protein phosphatase, partial [Candidatus Rifleibacterium sp.]|nr:SpoIIE family protein phosphatase [Candidatus Rifleibacterium sp.]